MQAMDELTYNSDSLLKIFVYGTLKPGEVNYQRYCAAKVVEVKRAIAFGQLFSLPFGYPAMTLGDSPVHGFLLSFSDLKILRQLDWLEDYNPQRPISENEYYRQQINTYDTGFRLLERAWAYLMIPQQVHIYGGVFLADGWWGS